MIGARTAIALYVALALHALTLMLLLLAPAPQMPAGAGQGLGIGLHLAGSDGVLTVPQSAQRSAGPQSAARNRGRGPLLQLPVGAAHGRDDPVQAFTQLADARGSGGGADRYFARLRQHLHRFRRELPLIQGAGRAEVALVVEADGSVSSLTLERRSLSALLDEEALALVRRAQPLPRPPGGASLRVVVPVLIDG